MMLIQQNGASQNMHMSLLLVSYLLVFVIAFARPMHDIIKCVEITG